MTNTIEKVARRYMTGNRSECIYKMTIEDYITGGIDMTEHLAISFGTVDGMSGHGGNSADKKFYLVWDGDNKKVLARAIGTGAEAAGDLDIGMWLVRFVGY